MQNKKHPDRSCEPEELAAGKRTDLAEGELDTVEESIRKHEEEADVQGSRPRRDKEMPRKMKSSGIGTAERKTSSRRVTGATYGLRPSMRRSASGVQDGGKWAGSGRKTVERGEGREIARQRQTGRGAKTRTVRRKEGAKTPQPRVVVCGMPADDCRRIKDAPTPDSANKRPPLRCLRPALQFEDGAAQASRGMRGGQGYWRGKPQNG